MFKLCHLACGRGEIYIFSFNFIVCVWLPCAYSTAKRKSILDLTETNGSFKNLLLIMGLDLHAQLNHWWCGRGESYIFFVNFIVCFRLYYIVFL